MPQEALAGWREIDAHAAVLPFTLDDIHVAPARTVPAIVEWVSGELIDRFATLDTPANLSVVPEPEEAGSVRRGRARGPAFDPYQARPIAAALAGGDVTQARRLVRSALEETVAGKRAEGGVRGARAVALVASVLEAAERASIDTGACWERYADFVSEARTTGTEKGHVDAAMRLLRVLKREADSGTRVSLDYKELNAIVIPRLVDGITLAEVSKLLDVKCSTLTSASGARVWAQFQSVRGQAAAGSREEPAPPPPHECGGGGEAGGRERSQQLGQAVQALRRNVAARVSEAVRESVMSLRERIRQWWARFRCPTEFLCDNCRYDHPTACHRSERPNAVSCPDYKPR